MMGMKNATPHFCCRTEIVGRCDVREDYSVARSNLIHFIQVVNIFEGRVLKVFFKVSPQAPMVLGEFFSREGPWGHSEMKVEVGRQKAKDKKCSKKTLGCETVSKSLRDAE
jgi:hypothetical protein